MGGGLAAPLPTSTQLAPPLLGAASTLSYRR
jgi:hypothetical protein